MTEELTPEPIKQPDIERLPQLESRLQVARIWYAKPEQSFFTKPEAVTLDRLTQTHTFLMELVFHPDQAEPVRALNFIYHWLQGENWSSSGQARFLIESKGLGHTSMSMGDVVEYQGHHYVVLALGFGRLDAECDQSSASTTSPACSPSSNSGRSCPNCGWPFP
jgi:hypothetical protein